MLIDPIYLLSKKKLLFGFMKTILYFHKISFCYEAKMTETNSINFVSM